MGPAAPTWTTTVPIDELLFLRAAGLSTDATQPTAVATSPAELRRIAKELDGAADASGRDDRITIIVALALCVLCWLLAAVAVAAIV
jgi:hypothetical protein